LEENDTLSIQENIIKKILFKDIPQVARLKSDEIASMEKMLKFIGKSEVDGINYSSISQNVGITKYKAEFYIELLRKAFILHSVFPSGTNVLKEPKVLMQLPYRLVYRGYEDALGGLREDFAVGVLEMRKMEFYYLKSIRGAKTPDYLITQESGDLVMEIGGKGKGREQFKGIEVEKKIIFSHPGRTEGIKRPLFLLGLI
jgi:predicted AAA+ superfamily ATPase